MYQDIFPDNFFCSGRGVGNFTRLESGFGGYMLVPIVLVGDMIALEVMLKSKWRKNTKYMFFLPVLFFMMCIRANTVNLPFYHFKNNLFDGNFSLFVIAFAATVIFFLHAWARKVKYADILSAVTLLVFILADIKMEQLKHFNIPPGYYSSVGNAYFELAGMASSQCYFCNCVLLWSYLDWFNNYS
ncbi:MAG: hypothetical protein GY750_11430 [Lentisphaerae bacterium]|nr:hypothetical protein [Lentisphaerota bacterium]